MSLHLVAEGVEDEATGRLIAEWGYDTIQGFLYSRPVPASRIDQLLVDRDEHAQQPPTTHARTEEQHHLTAAGWH